MIRSIFLFLVVVRRDRSFRPNPEPVWSMTAARMSTSPTAICWASAATSMKTRPVVMICIRSRPEERSQDRAASAREARPADDDRGDHPQLRPHAGVGVDGVGPARDDDPGQSGQDAGEHEGERLDPGRGDAREARGLLVAADEVRPAADRSGGGAGSPRRSWPPPGGPRESGPRAAPTAGGPRTPFPRRS